MEKYISIEEAKYINGYKIYLKFSSFHLSRGGMHTRLSTTESNYKTYQIPICIPTQESGNERKYRNK